MGLLQSVVSLVVFCLVEADRTLIVIYGQYRSFDITCPYLMKNIVQPNLPNARIIISLDEVHPVKFSPVAGLCLYPFLSNITVLGKRKDDDNKSRVPIEFLLMINALDYLASHNETYDYAIKVRTDNMILSPIRKVSALYGNFNRSQVNQHLNKFKKTLSFHYGRKPTNRESIYAWIITGGMSFFIPSMVFPPQTGPPCYCNPWCFKNSTIWNKNILMYIEGNSTLDQLNFESSIRDVMSKFKVIYLIGSTWVHFGPFELIREASYDIVRSYGTLRWNQFGYNDTLLRWEKVTESHMRLTHLANNWNLIDLGIDYGKSFNVEEDKDSLTENSHDPNLHTYLFRNCKRHPKRGECAINSDKYQTIPSVSN
mmetsp:Transcript_34181/g.32589  ORF Transcript_34181/g.32589 Transcript_34181/m.32589 type:complete len:369 (+) Transcript_34181:139-1245(+)